MIVVSDREETRPSPHPLCETLTLYLFSFTFSSPINCLHLFTISHTPHCSLLSLLFLNSDPTLLPRYFPLYFLQKVIFFEKSYIYSVEKGRDPTSLFAFPFYVLCLLLQRKTYLVFNAVDCGVSVWLLLLSCVGITNKGFHIVGYLAVMSTTLF